jgi:GH15 family glucan-1,4-alpha-glucosidase
MRATRVSGAPIVRSLESGAVAPRVLRLPEAPIQKNGERRTSATRNGDLGRIAASGVGPSERAVIALRVKNEPEEAIAALCSTDYYVRSEASRLLIEHPRARDALIAFVRDMESAPSFAKEAAVKALARIAKNGDEEAIRACLELFGRSHDQELTVALGRAPAELVEPAIERALQSGDLQLRRSAEAVARVREARKNPAPRISFPHLPVANGAATAVLEVEDGSLRHVRGTIFSAIDEKTQAKDAIEKLEIAVDPTDTGRVEAGYLPGTTIAWRRGEGEGVEWTRYAIAPLEGKKKLRVLLHAKSTSDEAREIRVSIGEKGIAKATLPAKGERWFELEIDLTKEGAPELELRPSSSGEALLHEERDRFERWQEESPLPALSKKERALFAHTRALMLMGQAEDGQVVASVPPGHWNISWVRDMSYALVALAASGSTDRAKKGLEFLIASDHQTSFEHHLHEGLETGVGRPYQISVVRHFGDGREEADVSDGSPNIEFDGFGLTLWALEEYVKRSGDVGFVRDHWETITGKIGEVIVDLVEKETGLIRPDSSIWERHLPGRRFTYTSAACERGLRALASLASRIGEGLNAERYNKAAEGLRTAIADRLVAPNGVIAGYAGDPDLARSLDASTIEVINWGLLDLDNKKGFDTALKTITAFREHLSVEGSPGFKRTTDPGWYEEQEWVVLDLRVASALFALAGSKEAARRGMDRELFEQGDALLEWVEKHVEANMGVIPELLGEGTRTFEGAVPMVGYGPGALVLALESKAEAKEILERRRTKPQRPARLFAAAP